VQQGSVETLYQNGNSPQQIAGFTVVIIIIIIIEHTLHPLYNRLVETF